MLRKFILIPVWTLFFFFGSAVVMGLVAGVSIVIQMQRQREHTAIVDFIGHWMGWIGIGSALLGFFLSIAGFLPGTRLKGQKPPPLPSSQ